MNPNIRIKVNSLIAYLKKEPLAGTELAPYFYQVYLELEEDYLELSEQTEIMIALNDDLLQRQNQQQSRKPVELPPF